jgi:hypothetical protein
LPDLEHSIKQYITNSSKDAALAFMRETSLGHESRSVGLRGLLSAWLGNAQHLWMWDYKSLESELQNAGFVGIRRAIFGDSTIPAFLEVEDRSRWDGCLGVECKRPS